MLAYTSNQPAPVYLTPAGGVETLTRDLIAPGINAEPTRLSAAYRLAALPDGGRLSPPPLHLGRLPHAEAQLDGQPHTVGVAWRPRSSLRPV